MYRIVVFVALVLSLGVGAAQGLTAPKGTLTQLRFSPDGRYILAQDGSEITILTVQPLAILFRIPAEKAEIAQFTPDSQQVVFVRSAIKVNPQTIAYKESGGHVERWSIAGQTPVASTTLPTMVCGTQQLSPAGDVLVCLDLEGRLRLFDVSSGQAIFDKKKFEILIHQQSSPDSGIEGASWGELGVAHIDFSPDARFVVVHPLWADGPTLLFDVRERRPVRLIGALKLLQKNWHAWIAPDRIVVTQGFASKSDVKRGYKPGRLVAFPTGKVLSQPRIPNGVFYRTADRISFVHPPSEHDRK